MSIACVVAFIATVQTKEDANEAVVLEADCAVDPSAPGCRRPSFLDMINGINNRAQVLFKFAFAGSRKEVRTHMITGKCYSAKEGPRRAA